MKASQRKAMFAKRGGKGLSSSDVNTLEDKIEKVEENSGISSKTARRIAKQTVKVADRKTKEVI